MHGFCYSIVPTIIHKNSTCITISLFIKYVNFHIPLVDFWMILYKFVSKCLEQLGEFLKDSKVDDLSLSLSVPPRVCIPWVIKKGPSEYPD